MIFLYGFSYWTVGNYCNNGNKVRPGYFIKKLLEVKLKYRFKINIWLYNSKYLSIIISVNNSNKKWKYRAFKINNGNSILFRKITKVFLTWIEKYKYSTFFYKISSTEFWTKIIYFVNGYV